MDIKKLIKASECVGIDNFRDIAKFTNTDEGKLMIVFLSRTLNTIKVNDWGREKDTDEYLGLDDKGWIIYTHDIEHLAGPVKITNEYVKRIDVNDVFDIVSKLSVKEYLDFVETCLEVRRCNKSDFDKYYINA